jgi:uncharacterized membrane protein YfcA
MENIKRFIEKHDIKILIGMIAVSLLGVVAGIALNNEILKICFGAIPLCITMLFWARGISRVSENK